MMQNYGVLRVVRVRPPVEAMRKQQSKYPSGWLPEERLVHLLTRRETSIGRALQNDLILMDPTVSREHARLVLDERGWRVCNLTMQNIVRVNGQAVAGGESMPLQPQDFLVIGNTTLQLIAPEFFQDDTGLPDQEQPLQAPYRDVLLSSATSDGSLTDGHVSDDLAGARGVPGERSARLIPTAADLAKTPVVPEGEFAEQGWEDFVDRLPGVGVTMQFALPQRMGGRTRWLIAGIGMAILLISVLITVVLNSLIGISDFTRSSPTNILVALTIPLIPAFGINLLVNFIDRFEREPWFLRLAAFLWGAIIAIPTALLIEQNVDRALLNVLGPNDLVQSILKGLNAGITEETVKGLGLLLLFLVLRDEFDNVTDGIVYGALIGAGFAMVENFVYFALYSKQFLLFLIVGRVVVGWLSHSTFTVCFGAALGYVRHTRVRWRQIVFPLLGYFCAVGLHSAFDFINFFANSLVLTYPDNANVVMISRVAFIGDYIPPFIAQIVLLYFLIKALAHEGAVIREFLAAEVSSGVVLVSEYALVQNSFQRTKVERRVLWEQGFRQWIRVKALYQTEIGLAFRKWHVSMGDKPKLGYLQPEDAYRRRIKRLRQEILLAEQQRKQGD